MTSRALLLAMTKRWYAVLIPFLIAAWLFQWSASQGGQFTTTTVVSFDMAAHSTLAPYNGNNNKNVISFASAVAQQINDGHAPQSYAHADAPLYGAAVRQATLVWVPNDGGQWANYYPRAEIEIEIVGRSRTWVESKQSQLVQRVFDATSQSQASLGIADSRRIDVSVVPATLEIEPVSVGPQARVLASIALGFAALICGSGAALAADALLNFRTRVAQSRSQRKVQLTVRSSTS